MEFSLEWVQSDIQSFGGDPSRVTISGESAGAGAVMLLTMAYGGAQGSALFQNAIVASPYLPMQWDYDGIAPTRAYRHFAQEVRCLNDVGTSEFSVFECLQGKDTISLQNASAHVSMNAPYGQWAFLPVTNGKFLRKSPCEQLQAGEVNGNNADEGPGFVPQTIHTADNFDLYIEGLFPLVESSTISEVKKVYAIQSTIPGPLYSTLGSSGPTALNQSEFGIGQQQRANNLYAEITFVCPGCWLASAYSARSGHLKEGKKAWKYQYSVPPGEHGADLDAYYAINRETLGYGTLLGFRVAVQRIWGRFVVFNDPTLPLSTIKNITALPDGSAPGDDIADAGAGKWPSWDGESEYSDSYRMLNLNMTGGHETEVPWTSESFNITQYAGPGLTAKFDIVDAWNWEGERGKRCQFWADVSKLVPE